MGKNPLSAFGIGLLAGLAGIAFVLVGIVAVFVYAIFGALIGAITGWLVNIAPVLGPAVTNGFIQIGIKQPDLVALGAMLGFIAGFFKNHGFDKKDCCEC
jgi:hypothetical protein